MSNIQEPFFVNWWIATYFEVLLYGAVCLMEIIGRV